MKFLKRYIAAENADNCQDYLICLEYYTGDQEVMLKEERFFINFARNALQARTGTPWLAIYGETGMYPLAIQCASRILEFIKHVDTRCKADRLCSPWPYIWKELVKNQNGKGSLWMKRALKWLPQLGEGVIDLQHVNVKETKMVLYKNYKEKWLQSVYQQTEGGSKGKMALIYSIKPNWEQDDYIKSNNIKSTKIIFNVRASNHTLPVERLRYVPVKRENRWCPEETCTGKQIGDEFHFFACPKNKEKITSIWSMISKHPNCAKLMRDNITELTAATMQDDAWSDQWLSKWEYDIRIATETALKLNTSVVIKFLKQIWTPFQLYYTSQ